MWDRLAFKIEDVPTAYLHHSSIILVDHIKTAVRVPVFESSLHHAQLHRLIARVYKNNKTATTPHDYVARTSKVKQNESWSDTRISCKRRLRKEGTTLKISTSSSQCPEGRSDDCANINGIAREATARHDDSIQQEVYVSETESQCINKFAKTRY